MRDAEYRRIPIKAKDTVVWTLVDEADYAELAQHRWRLGSDGYAVRSGPRNNYARDASVRMHRVIMGLKRGDGLEVDHINRDRLDNRRENLRVVTRAINGRNLSSRGGTSRYRGVSWHKDAQKWTAHATFEGRQHNLGLFASERVAAAVINAFWTERGCFAPNDVSDDATAVAAPSN